LASLVEVCAAVLQLLRGPLCLQAMVARVVASVAIILEGVRLGRATIVGDTRWRWQIIGAPPVSGPAAIELLGTRPALDPLEWSQLIVACIAIEWAWRCGRPWRVVGHHWGRCRWASNTVVLAAPGLLRGRPQPLGVTIIGFLGAQLWQEIQEERHQEQQQDEGDDEQTNV